MTLDKTVKRFRHDALLLLSFGGPESLDEVRPFLDGILEGKRISAARRQAIEEKYQIFNGKSPLNEQCRQLRMLLGTGISGEPPFPVYWGTLHWKPTFQQTIEEMNDQGIRFPLVFILSPFNTPQSYQRYWDALQGLIPSTWQVALIPPFYSHPLYLQVAADRLLTTLAEASLDIPMVDDRGKIESASSTNKAETLLLFSAHSLPIADALSSHYEEQLREHCHLLLQMIHYCEPSPLRMTRDIAWQSRSGAPTDRWLEPDVKDNVTEFRHCFPQAKRVIVVPSGFMLENMETIYDLDLELKNHCTSLELHYYRVATAGIDSRMAQMCREYLQGLQDRNEVI